MKWIKLAAAATGLLATAVLVPATMGTASAAPVANHASAVPVSGQGAPPVPVLNWGACHSGFQCATAQLPLDYKDPDDTKISLAVIRHLATDPARRLGTMFVNLGGPEEQIEPFVSGFTAMIPAELRARYDIISFDPRGFGLSTAVRCFSNMTEENTFLAGLPLYPVGAQQDSEWEQAWARFDGLCAQRNGRLLDHVTTADTARDMNLLRQAVGAPTLNYLGASDGSALGAIYANLFPATTGHMVLDGSVDPVAWSSSGTLPAVIRQNRDLADVAALRSYLDLCGQAPVSACAFSAGTPAATEAKFATLEKRLLHHPVTIGTPPQTVTYANLVNPTELEAVSTLQSNAVLLQQLWVASASSSHAAPTSAAAASPGATAVAPTAPANASGDVYTGLDQTYAVICTDNADPRNVSDYEAAARLAEARAGGFGLYWAWQEEACAHWPTAAQDRYTGPWNRRTASTILVMSLTNDPITTYQNAIAMTRDLARARLLTIDGFGHTELLNNNPSTCATNYEVNYLTTGALPPAGTVCAQGTPFPVPSS
ncbi:MAG TPA: alpha/beta fold hydrolase [Pseudonocardiaceae bacterium]|nr:alpha/beta fold hydrolase [Pseudonocardiaceae bacterium]